MRALRFFDNLMSKLPANGDKLAFSLSFKALLPLLGAVIPGFQPVAAAMLLDDVANLAILLSSLHKASKKVLEQSKEVIKK